MNCVRPLDKKCYLCGEPCDEDNYCYGCGKYICSTCDENAVMGDHKPEEHTVDYLELGNDG